jgi:fructokinase
VTPKRLGAIEAGGTKFLCAVGTPEGELLQEIRIPTDAPAETIPRVIDFFRLHADSLAAIGIASFGPVQIDRNSPQYGFITTTPKAAWRHFDLLGTIRRAIPVPAGFDTDVNAAALAEARWGAAKGLRAFLYVTVGTGIGGGALMDGSPLHGMTHAEMGHIRVPHDLSQDPFAGICPFHGDCLEGLASGPAMEARWQAPASTLAPDHAAWPLEADYLARACLNWICVLSPQRIVLGGGVMRPDLFPPIRRRVCELLNGYLDVPELTREIDRYIVPSPLEGRAGLLGALELASRALASPGLRQA